MSISRTLYAGQSVKIVCNNGQYTGYLPVKTANCEVSKPIESVAVFGKLNSVATAQNNLTTCKASISTYLNNTAENTIEIPSSLPWGLLSFSDILYQSLLEDARNGNYTVVTVEPNGFTMSGILSNISLGLSIGSFGTCDLAFDGIGEPKFDAAPTSSAFSEAAAYDYSNATPVFLPSGMAVPIKPVTVGDFHSHFGCITSFSANIDCPTEILACLSSKPNEIQGPLQNSTISTKPPYRSTIKVEGYGIDISNQDWIETTLAHSHSGFFGLGDLGIALSKVGQNGGEVTSLSFNNAVGTPGAMYSFTAEGTSLRIANTSDYAYLTLSPLVYLNSIICTPSDSDPQSVQFYIQNGYELVDVMNCTELYLRGGSSYSTSTILSDLSSLLPTFSVDNDYPAGNANGQEINLSSPGDYSYAAMTGSANLWLEARDRFGNVANSVALSKA